MNEYDACEQAFKRGYERGVKEFADELLGKYCFHNSEGEGFVFDTDIYNLAKEMGVEL